MEPRSPRQTRRIAVAVLGLLVLAALAWAIDLSARNDSGSYRVTVLSDDDVLATLTLSDLRAMESRRVMMQGQLQEGPALLEVLRTAGVERFDSVVVRGMGLRDVGSLELEWSEVDEDVLLDFAIRDTVKLCGPEIAWADRVRDVEEIEVR